MRTGPERVQVCGACPALCSSEASRWSRLSTGRGLPGQRDRVSPQCILVLTCCDEGKMTRDGNTRRGDMTQGETECQQIHKIGRFNAQDWAVQCPPFPTSSLVSAVPGPVFLFQNTNRCNTVQYHTHATNPHATLACPPTKALATPNSPTAAKEA